MAASMLDFVGVAPEAAAVAGLAEDPWLYLAVFSLMVAGSTVFVRLKLESRELAPPPVEFPPSLGAAEGGPKGDMDVFACCLAGRKRAIMLSPTLDEL